MKLKVHYTSADKVRRVRKYLRDRSYLSSIVCRRGDNVLLFNVPSAMSEAQAAAMLSKASGYAVVYSVVADDYSLRGL